MDTLSRYRGALFGLATGDAVGTAVEFMPRRTFDPVTNMRARAYYGEQSIPRRWLDLLVMRDDIGLLAEALYSKETPGSKKSRA